MHLKRNDLRTMILHSGKTTLSHCFSFHFYSSDRSRMVLCAWARLRAYCDLSQNCLVQVNGAHAMAFAIFFIYKTVSSRQVTTENSLISHLQSNLIEWNSIEWNWTARCNRNWQTAHSKSILGANDGGDTTLQNRIVMFYHSEWLLHTSDDVMYYLKFIWNEMCEHITSLILDCNLLKISTKFNSNFFFIC